MSSKRLLILLLILPLSFCSNQENPNRIKDIIPAVNLIAGRSDSVLVSDLFYYENYDLSFSEHADISLSYDKKTGYLKFTPDSSFEGIAAVSFEVDNEVYSFPVKSRIIENIGFRFVPKTEYRSINLFGSFNGWNRSDIPMTDDDGDGVYTAEIQLEPGRHEYKFFADGEELLDPENEDIVSNGIGGFNSVLYVGERHPDQIYLHLMESKPEDNLEILRFYFDGKGEFSQLKVEDILLLLNNKTISADNIKIDRNIIDVRFDKAHLSGEKLIRAAVNRAGNTTNVQSLLLRDGSPIGSEGGGFRWQDGIIYSLMIDRFEDGDSSLNNPILHDSLFDKANYMGGDFRGLTQRIKEGYFDSLGVNILWISPVYDNPNEAYREYPAPHRWFSGYHGYWPISHTDTEEKFGSLDELKELVSIAHRHGLKVLLDFVSNHVHEGNPVFISHRDWFGQLDLPDGRKNLRFWDEFRLTTWFEPYLPSFDFLGAPEAIDYVVNNAVWWLKETGADGYRHDAVKHVPNEFWRELTRKLKTEVEPLKSQNVYQIGETFGSYDLISSYVNNGQLNAQFNFNLYDVAFRTFIDPDASFNALNLEMMKTIEVYGVNHVMGNVMDSHDKIRFMAYADGDISLNEGNATEIGWNNPPMVDDAENYKKAELYLAYMNTIPGLPVIYYGSEFGMSGASDPDNRRMMRFGDELTDAEKAMLERTRQILSLRNSYPALRYGDFLPLKSERHVYSYLRSYFSERLIIILNKSEEIKRVDLTLPEFFDYQSAEDLVNEDIFPVERERVSIVVNPMSWRVLKLSE